MDPFTFQRTLEMPFEQFLLDKMKLIHHVVRPTTVFSKCTMLESRNTARSSRKLLTPQPGGQRHHHCHTKNLVHAPKGSMSPSTKENPINHDNSDQLTGTREWLTRRSIVQRDGHLFPIISMRLSFHRTVGVHSPIILPVMSAHHWISKQRRQLHR